MVNDIFVIVDNEKSNTTSKISILILSPTEGAILNHTVRVHGVTWSESEEVLSVSIRIEDGSPSPESSTLPFQSVLPLEMPLSRGEVDRAEAVLGFFLCIA